MRVPMGDEARNRSLDHVPLEQAPIMAIVGRGVTYSY